MGRTVAPKKFSDEGFRENKTKKQNNQVGGILYISMMSLIWDSESFQLWEMPLSCDRVSFCPIDIGTEISLHNLT